MNGFRDSDHSLARIITEVERAVPEREEPFRVFSLALNRTLGEFVDQNIFSAFYKNISKNGSLYMYYRADRNYKIEILRMNPYIDFAVQMSGKSSYPMDYFDYVADKPVRHPNDEWYREGFSKPDILLTPA